MEHNKLTACVNGELRQLEAPHTGDFVALVKMPLDEYYYHDTHGFAQIVVRAEDGGEVHVDLRLNECNRLELYAYSQSNQRLTLFVDGDKLEPYPYRE